MATENQAFIHDEMTIEEILNKYPHKSQKIAHALTSAGLHCVGCGAAVWETLRAGMLGHGKHPDEIVALTAKINQLIADDDGAIPDQIVITEKAAKKYLEILSAEGKQGWGLRFSEKAGGCGGYEYVLDFSEKAGAEDEVIPTDFEIELHVNKNQKERLLGSTIDYIEGLTGAGFKVSNPNVRSSCGCGSSHNYA